MSQCGIETEDSSVKKLSIIISLKKINIIGISVGALHSAAL